MEQVMLQKQILSKLESMEKRLNYVVEYIEDSRLSTDDKKALKQSLKEEKSRKFSKKFMQEIKESEEAYKRGDFVIVKNAKERRKLFDSL